MSKKNGLADPTCLKPFDPDDKQMLRVVIETPKGSRNKFAFNPDEHIFELKKVFRCTLVCEGDNSVYISFSFLHLASTFSVTTFRVAFPRPSSAQSSHKD